MNTHAPLPSAYAQVGGKLIDLGYCAVPVVPGRKAPGMLLGGRWVFMQDWTNRYQDRLPSEREVEAWERTPGGGVCVLLGEASGHLVAVDIDDNAAVEAVSRALPYTPVRKRGRKGETLFFRSEVLKSRAFDAVSNGVRSRLVDLLCEGRQTLLPPTIHPDTGHPYTWTGEQALQDVPVEELPWIGEEAYARIAEALAPFGFRAITDRPDKPPAGVSSEEESAFRQLNEHALANLDLWVPMLKIYGTEKSKDGWVAVPEWRPSNTGRPLAARKKNLSFHPKGISDFGASPQGLTAIDVVQLMHRAPNVTAAFAWLASATGWGSQVFHDPQPRAKVLPQPEPEVAGKAAAVGIPIADPMTVPATSRTSAPAVKAPPPWRATEDVTDCPGLVGEITRWITDSAISPQPLLALGAALTLVGTVAGRQLAGPTDSGTHLYVIAVAPTGAGKDHPLRAINAALVESQLSNLVGPGRFTSESSIISTVIRSPSCACGIDEFGAFLARNKSRNASSHEQGISSMLRTLWGSSFKSVSTTERAGEQFKFIHSPAMSIYGTSTSGELYAALGDADTRNGLLNRFLILENSVRPVERDPLVASDVPARVVEGLKAIYWRLGELAAANYHGAGDHRPGKPEVVPWRDEDAKRVHDEFRAEVRTQIDSDPESDKFFARSLEMAVRLATIRAVGIDWKDPRVTKEDMLWGITLARLSAQVMIEGARDNIAETYWEVGVNKVVNAAKKHKLFKVRDIQIATKMRSKEIAEILVDLVEMGRIVKKDVTDARSDSKRTFAYEFVR